MLVKLRKYKQFSVFLKPGNPRTCRLFEFQIISPSGTGAGTGNELRRRSRQQIKVSNCSLFELDKLRTRINEKRVGETAVRDSVAGKIKINVVVSLKNSHV